MKQLVIAAVDGSAVSAAAARWAADEAVRRGVPLRLVHAGPWLASPASADRQRCDFDAASDMLARCREKVQGHSPGLDIDTQLAVGPVVPTLLAVADQGDVLVLGSQGLGGLSDLLIGSVSMAAVTSADVPVIVVRGAQQGALDGSEVVVGLDWSSPAPAVIEFAFTEAALRGARVRAVSGIHARERGRSATERTARTLSQWRVRYPGTDVIQDVRNCGAAAALTDASSGADLLVVGRCVPPRRAGVRLGPVAHAAMHTSEAPVAVVPHPGTDLA